MKTTGSCCYAGLPWSWVNHSASSSPKLELQSCLLHSANIIIFVRGQVFEARHPFVPELPMALPPPRCWNWACMTEALKLLFSRNHHSTNKKPLTQHNHVWKSFAKALQNNLKCDQLDAVRLRNENSLEDETESVHFLIEVSLVTSVNFACKIEYTLLQKTVKTQEVT